MISNRHSRSSSEKVNLSVESRVSNSLACAGRRAFLQGACKDILEVTLSSAIELFKRKSITI